MKLLVIEKTTKWSKFSPEYQDQLVTGRVQMSEYEGQLFRAHAEHTATMKDVRGMLDRSDAVVQYKKVGFRSSPEEAGTDNYNAIITVGGDGTVLYASHYTRGPVLAINSSPSSSVGYYCTKMRVDTLLSELLSGSLDTYILTRMELLVDCKPVSKCILNDVLYCDSVPAIAARYQIYGEDQVSSGIWISTPAGSTAGIRSAGGHTMQLSSRNLQFLVREPYQPNHNKLKYTHGFVSHDSSFDIKNNCESGVLFVDGTQLVTYLMPGSEIRLQVSDNPLYLLQPIE